MAAATGSIQVDAAGGSFDSATNPEFVINDGTNTFTFVIDNDARGVNSSATQLSDAYAGKLHVPTFDEADGATNALIAVNLHKMGMWWEGNSGNTDPTIVLTDAAGQSLSLTYAQPGTIPSGTRIAGNSGSSKNNVYRTDANNYILHQRNTTDSGATHNLLFYWAIKYAYENDSLAIRPYIVTNSSGGTSEPAVGSTASGYYSILLKSTTSGFLGNTCNIKVTGTIDDNYLQTDGTDGSGGTIGYFYEEYADSSVYNRTAGYMAQLAGVSGGVYFKNGTVAGSGSDASLSAANIAEAIKVMIDSDLIGISASRSDVTVSLTSDTDGTGGNQTITKNVAANSLLTLSGMSGGSSGAGGGSVAANRLSEYGNYIVMERVSGSKSPTVGKEGEKIVPSDAGTVSYANAGFMFYSGSSEANSKFFSVMGSGSVAREVVHQLDTFTGSVVLPGSEKIEFNGAGSGEQLFSSTGGQMDLDADTLIELTAPTIELAGATKVDIQSDAVHFGENGNDDVVLTFNGDGSDGVLKWMEDEDYFEFSDDIFMASGEKVQFGDAGEHISGDGSSLSIVSSNDATIDAANAIVLDADVGRLEFRDGGVLIGGLVNESSDLILSSSQADKDIVFKGNDGGSSVTALTLDMSAAGAAAFSSTVTAVGSFIIGSADMSEADLEKLDGITDGTAAANKALVLDTDLSIGTIQNLTASFAKIGTLDVDVLNSVTKTATSLEISDKLIIAGLSGSTSDVDGGGLQIGSQVGATGYAAAVLWNDGNSALDFRLAGSTIAQVRSSALLPGASNAKALGSTSLMWSDLFLGDGAVVNFNNGDVTMTHSSNLLSVAGGNTRVIRLEIDGASDYIDVDTDLQVIAAADILLDPAGGEVKVDGNVVPNSDSADALGASGTAWSNLYVDAIDLNGQGDISMGGTGRIDLDADDNTSIRAIADDVIAIEIGGTDRLLLSASNMAPLVSDGYALGDLGNHWSDLFLASGAVVNFNAGDVTMTHASNLLTIAGGNTRVDRLEIDGATNYIDVDTNLQISASADILLDPAGGDVKVDGNVVPNADDGGSLGSANLNWSDLYLADAAVLNFGDDQDVSLTHVVDTGILLSSSDQLQFGDSGTYIHQSADAALDIVSDGSVNVTAGAAGLVLKGTTPKLTIGDAGAEDTFLVFDGNAQDYRMGLDDGTDKLELGVGAAHGSTIAFTVDSSAVTSFIGSGGSGEGMIYTPGDNTMTMVDSSGNTFVTVGGDASGEFAIDVAQATSNSGKIRATAFVTYSDENLKTNVTPMDNAMDTVMKLQGVNFDWKNDGASDFGFIAQDLQKVIPQAVSETSDDNSVMGVDYSRLTAVLVEAMKAQQTEIETLKSAIAKLSK